MSLHNLCRRLLPVTLLALSSTLALAGVVKWVDANGQVHYGDRPPDGASTNTVQVKVQPAGRPVTPVNAPTADDPPANMVGEKQRSIADERQAHSDEVDRRNAEGMAAMARAARATEERNNKDLIAKCKAARETYCDKGADEIRRKQYEHDSAQADAQMDAAFRRGGVVPVPQRIRPRPPCEWPRTCKSK